MTDVFSFGRFIYAVGAGFDSGMRMRYLTSLFSDLHASHPISQRAQHVKDCTPGGQK
jgi:hypothetical protein